MVVHRSPLLAVAWLVVAAALALWMSLQIDLQLVRVCALMAVLGAFGLTVASIGTLRAATGQRGRARWRALGLPARDYAFSAIFAGLSGYGVAHLL